MHSEEESFRGTIKVRNPEGEPHTVIVMRRGMGSNAQVWVTLNGAWKTTLCMSDPEVAQLIELITRAQRGRT
ncbi:MAG TPA: hypothetical protein VFQ77_20120 [Pseudonocardiaceae bacterium]|jgi:hypothetical protein|nr:hypothetical protein [Pseudonocardiaceae bacterium]